MSGTLAGTLFQKALYIDRLLWCSGRWNLRVMIGAGRKEYPEGMQVVLVFTTVCVHLEDHRGVAVCAYCLQIVFSLVKKEYVLFFFFWNVKM